MEKYATRTLLAQLQGCYLIAIRYTIHAKHHTKLAQKIKDELVLRGVSMDRIRAAVAMD